MSGASGGSLSYGELETFKQIAYGVRDADEQVRRGSVHAIDRLNPDRLRLLLQFFDYDSEKAHRANRIKLTILGAFVCFAVVAMIYIYCARIDGNAKLLTWFEELLVFNLLYFAFLGSTWFDYLTAPFRRNRVFGPESRLWPRDAGALCAALVETKELRLFPALVNNALTGGRPGIGDLELPIRSLMDVLELGDRNVLNLALRYRLYHRLYGSQFSGLQDLKIAVFGAAERTRDTAAINHARRVAGNKWIAAHQPRLHQAAAIYLAAIDQSLGQTGAPRSVAAPRYDEPPLGAVGTFRESVHTSRPYLALFQILILIFLIAASWWFGAARRQRLILAKTASVPSVGHIAVNSPPGPAR